MKKKYTLLMRSSLLLLMTFFVVTSRAQILYSQNTLAAGEVIAKQEFDFGGGAIAQVADDFEVPGGQTWIINQVDLKGSYVSTPDAYSRVGAVTIKFYADDSGIPGMEVFSMDVTVTADHLDPDLALTIPGGVVLPPGIYWMGIYTTLWGESYQSWFWKSTNTVMHNPAVFKNTAPSFPPEVINWTPVYEVYSQSPVDMLFTLRGTSEGMAAPARPDSLVVSMTDSAYFFMTWADNASDETGFVIERSTDGMSYTVAATVGANITSYADYHDFDPALRYYYRVMATSDNGNSLYSNVAYDDVLQVVYAQPDGGGLGTHSQQWRNDDTYEGVRSADDFVVPQNQTWSIKKILAPGFMYPADAYLEHVTVEIFSNDSPYDFYYGDSIYHIEGQPATSVYKRDSIRIAYNERHNPSLEITLPEVVQLSPGHYWVSVYPTTQVEQYWLWHTALTISNVVALINDPLGLQAEATGDGWAPVHLAGEDVSNPDEPVDLVFTLLGATIVTPLDSLPAPIAMPALNVTPAQFTANWTNVEGADHYELDVIAVKDSTFLTGYENKVVYGTSQLVTGTRPSHRYRYVVRAINENAESQNSNSIIVAPVKDLTLRTVCSDNPGEYRRWKIINNNPFAVAVAWHVSNTSQNGNLQAVPGETFFTTQTVPGVINYANITWYDDEGQQHASVKSSTWKSCDAIVARGGSINDDVEDDGREFSLVVASWPNPVEGKFNVILDSVDDAPVKVEIVNLRGQCIYHAMTERNRVLQVDGSSYAPGLYLIRAQQQDQQKVIKMMKK